MAGNVEPPLCRAAFPQVSLECGLPAGHPGAHRVNVSNLPEPFTELAANLLAEAQAFHEERHRLSAALYRNRVLLIVNAAAMGLWILWLWAGAPGPV